MLLHNQNMQTARRASCLHCWYGQHSKHIASVRERQLERAGMSSLAFTVLPQTPDQGSQCGKLRRRMMHAHGTPFSGQDLGADRAGAWPSYHKQLMSEIYICTSEAKTRHQPLGMHHLEPVTPAKSASKSC